MNKRPDNRLKTRRLACCLLLCLCETGQAAYKEDIGFSRLAAELGDQTPNGAGVPVSHVEASTSGSDNPVYLPDRNAAEFSGKEITDASDEGDGGFSGHATSVGKRFYGNSSSIAAGIDSINAFWADDWLQSGYLRFGSYLKPRASADRIANHSWIADMDGAAVDANLLRRIDWLIETDEFIQCVGIKNRSSPNSPLLSSAYNVIAIGKSDGLNGYGTVQLDPEYVSGRARPEIVAPLSTSSSTTPVVAAAAALLVEAGHADPGLSTDPAQKSKLNRNRDTVYNAERSEVIKAVLMAGADRSADNGSAADIADYRADPAQHTDNGLDRRFGAGQVNIYNSYHILHAGEQNSAEDGGSGSIGTAGFDFDPAFGGANGRNTAASYYFSTTTGPVMLFATLAWNIQLEDSGAAFPGAAQLFDLDLHLYDISEEPVLLASSASAIDNSETLWQPLPAGGNYLLRVAPKPGQAPFDWDYALAWRMQELSDTDGDGLPDRTDPDDDNDDLPDADEAAAGTDPLNADSDGDLALDGTEVLAGTDPLSPADFPIWGDLNADGGVGSTDVLLAARAALGAITLDGAQLARGNVAPLVNGTPLTLPTDPFDTADLLLIVRKAVGAADF